MMKDMSGYKIWFNELERLAKTKDVPLGDEETYIEYYQDGDTPKDALDVEMSYMDGDDEES